MRTTSLIAASILAIATLAACNEQPAAPAPDPAAAAAATETAVAEALGKRDADETAVHSDPGPAVYFVNLRDGQTVTSPFRIVFGVYGKGVAPAEVDKPDTGHHHLLIDTELSEEEMKFAIPKDEQHMHFGAGQTETVLMLPAGQHTLQLIFGDMKHEMIKPAPMMSQKITVTVK
jgi:Domain of unknown function (DUF4399)